jgi:hypothetical protein
MQFRVIFQELFVRRVSGLATTPASADVIRMPPIFLDPDRRAQPTGGGIR